MIRKWEIILKQLMNGLRTRWLNRYEYYVDNQKEEWKEEIESKKRLARAKDESKIN